MDYQIFYYFFSLAVVLLLGAMMPGQSFILVAKASMTISRAAGIATAFGMGVGIFLFAIAVVLGATSLIDHYPRIFNVLKVLGAIYIIWIGFSLIRRSKQPLDEIDAKLEISKNLLIFKCFYQGLLVQIANPNTIIIFGSIFAAFMPQANEMDYFYVPVLAFLIDFIWYLFVALVLSCARPKATYIKNKIFFDCIGGITLLVIGLKLVYSSF